jgi:hypothetical protein
MEEYAAEMERHERQRQQQLEALTIWQARLRGAGRGRRDQGAAHRMATGTAVDHPSLHSVRGLGFSDVQGKTRCRCRRTQGEHPAVRWPNRAAGRPPRPTPPRAPRPQAKQEKKAAARPEAKRWIDPALIERYYREAEDARAAEEARRIGALKASGKVLAKNLDEQARASGGSEAGLDGGGA